MQRITIEVADDGQITVTAESPDEKPETMSFDSIEDAAAAVQELMVDARDDAATGESSPDDENAMQSMWNEEAAQRPNNPNLMR